MKLFRRERYLQKIRGFYEAEDIIKVITGVRRCGKSSLMQMVADELLTRGVPEQNIIYIDLDKREYRRIKDGEALEQLLAERKLAPGTQYLFIDEIQNVAGFEEIINALRNEGGYSIFITGSNSYLLSGELATKLTGRYVEFELFPLTFSEYVAMKRFYDQPVDVNPAKELQAYTLEGGFPRTVLLPELQDKHTYVSNVVDEIFAKDISRRVKIRDKQTFAAVRDYIINNFGATTSIVSLQAALRKSGLQITRQTVQRYIQALVDAKILYICDRFDMKSKRSLRGEKKYYLSDLSFYFSRNTDNRINFGPVLENIVYIYARSLGCQVSVGRIGKLEVDFILRTPAQDYAYVQVAYTIMASEATEEREYRPLEQIRDNYAKYVLTMDSLLQKRNGIKHFNLAEFMLGEGQF